MRVGRRVHTFADSYAEGLKGEAQVAEYLRFKGCEVTEVTDRKRQSAGIDFDCISADGKPFTVEVKRDAVTQKYGNIAVETWGHVEKKRLGWARKRGADLLFYIVVPTHILVIETKDLSDELIDQWAEEYPVKTCKNRKRGGGFYHSAIVCVPEPVFAELAKYRIQLK